MNGRYEVFDERLRASTAGGRQLELPTGSS